MSFYKIYCFYGKFNFDCIQGCLAFPIRIRLLRDAANNSDLYLSGTVRCGSVTV